MLGACPNKKHSAYAPNKDEQPCIRIDDMHFRYTEHERIALICGIVAVRLCVQRKRVRIDWRAHVYIESSISMPLSVWTHVHNTQTCHHFLKTHIFVWVGFSNSTALTLTSFT